MNFRIHTERTVIRPYEEADVLRVAPLLAGSPDGRGGIAVTRIEDVATWVARAREDYAQFGMGRMVVELENGLLIGDCGITREMVEGATEECLGVIITPEYRGRGYGTECARAMLLYGMMKKGMKRVISFVPEEMPGATAIATRIGMVPEGNGSLPGRQGLRLYSMGAG
jgi:[ribosomal protein S5]-alanine N-acetyltransferase